ncbi:hypothetical protein [Uliginosibacterium gangwonense]|uniref:hypothetical protein n=1 Tax=Uliginosibacterium gangwonense TaxID=392736 RepID=UPI0012FADCB6|nr:hypothetical protein [Uliginosibacterium gangwonense]
MSEEFLTVELIVASSAETRGVDAFALALIKAERQIRKIFTHLVFQSQHFSASDISMLRETLALNKRVYFEGFEKGVDALSSVPVATIVGNRYQALRAKVVESITYRNKIFHGQLTDKSLTREDLLSLTSDIQSWCLALAEGGSNHYGYDGFARNSFRKGLLANNPGFFKIVLNSRADYEQLLQNHVQRPR